MSSRGRGRLFIVSAPSGAGKTTVVRRMIELTPDITISRSYTSRPIRAGELDGVDYTFVSAERFRAMPKMSWRNVSRKFKPPAEPDGR